MNVDGLIDDLSAEASERVRDLLRQAYDRGFREALATSGQPPRPVEPDRAAHLTSPTLLEGGVSHDDGRTPLDVEWDEQAEEADDGAAHGTAVRPIWPHATIGTLRKRIYRTFGLERFDIDVVICRHGDRDRRQLKATARLALYRTDDK